MINQSLKILLIEDDALTAMTNKRMLESCGKVTLARNIDEAHDLLTSGKYNLAFFDLNLYGKLDGLKLLKLAKVLGVYSIVLSGETKKEILEESFLSGAKDYLSKPFSEEKLRSVLNRFLNYRKEDEFKQLIDEKFITSSESLKEELLKISNLSFSDKPVFIEGETGTGKRVVAHLVRDVLEIENFVEINCSQYTDELFSSELFGHVKGAFSGATSNKKGLLEVANDGVIFMDEIHSLSIKSQKTLLKAIEEKEFYPVGSDKKIKSNFRVVSATCEDILELIAQSQFRQDLYARISTFQISLSPLRERKGDIQKLLQFFIDKQPFQIVVSDKSYELLKEYAWPQNTREIQDLVENWVVHGQRLITPEQLPANIRNNISPNDTIVNEYILDVVEEMGLKEFMTIFKKEIVNEMTRRHDGVLKRASSSMGVSYTTLIDFMKKHRHKAFGMRSY